MFFFFQDALAEKAKQDEEWQRKVIIISGASAREARQRSTMGKKNW